jgi:Flp pilus assembly protein TadG
MLSPFRNCFRRLLRDRAGHVAVTLALAAIPLTFATGAGIDYARGLVVRSNMADALDAAALAVGKQSSKPSSCSTASGSTSSQQSACAGMLAIAQKFFNANIKRDYYSTGAVPTVVITIANESVTLTATDNVPTTFLAVADRMIQSTALDNMAVSASSTVVWGQTKLWVALVLDNSGSMSDSDSHGSKMDALQSASHTLLTTLQNASQTAGDVQVGIVPFTRVAKVGTSNASASWLYWGWWEGRGQANGVDIQDTPNPYSALSDAQVPNPVASGNIGMAAFGPGDSCPFTYDTTSRSRTTIHTQSPFGYYCTSSSANSAGNTDSIPSSGTYKGYICPGADSGTYNPDRHDVYYNGCWNSVKDGSNTITVSSGSSASCQDSDGNGFSSSNCSCSTSHGTTTCKTQRWTHTWVINNHNTWLGCIADRDKTSDYDVLNTAPVGTNTTGVPAVNNTDGCLAASITNLGYSWSSLSTQIDNMSPGGTTNQAIGVANGWLMLTPGNPFNTPSIPANTTRYIILLSDGLNTEDRWWGDGSTVNSTQDGYIDTRENTACTNAKHDGVVIYTLFLDINGTQGNSAPLQNCATDTAHYYDLTSTTQVATAFAAIAQQITNLRVSQ